MVTERLDRFMARANAAYYATRDPFRDFTTAPEIGQMLGELAGAWAAVIWGQMGAPDPVLLIEAGPGRGTLMRDALRAIGRVAPAFRAALRLHLIETSPRLRAEQAGLGLPAQWHDTLAAVPAGPIILLANEFLDALPIRQFVRRGPVWCERHVAGGRFVDVPVPGLAHPGDDGSVVAFSDAAVSFVTALSDRLAAFGGAALILDYGTALGAAGDSLQALRDGRPADPLSAPGSADLTAHVDFAALRVAAERAGVTAWGPVAQGTFLGRLGLAARTERLIEANPGRAASLLDAASRLASPLRMGDLFQALSLTNAKMPCPPGFEGP